MVKLTGEVTFTIIHASPKPRGKSQGFRKPSIKVEAESLPPQKRIKSTKMVGKPAKK